MDLRTLDVKQQYILDGTPGAARGRKPNLEETHAETQTATQVQDENTRRNATTQPSYFFMLYILIIAESLILGNSGINSVGCNTDYFLM